jgi:NADPH-dependent 2,4-dienoyl-CoA reductase/sulfur reductase-like enzyme
MVDQANCNAPMLPAAAMAHAGQSAFRRSVRGQPRGPLCGMGVCFECRATVNGEPHRLTCQAAPGSSEAGPRAYSFDILIVGSGKAAIAAAKSAFYAAEGKKRIGVVDDSLGWGGQIWHRGTNRAESCGDLSAITLLAQTRVVGQLGPGQLLGESPAGPVVLAYQRLILAPGAREFFLPFPGWTLPHVMGAGGLQLLVKSGWPIQGKRVIVAGSGPLLLAAAAHLTKEGAVVPWVIEQAPWPKVRRFARSLVWQPKKLLQAFGMRWKLRGTKFKHGHWVAAAHGDDRLREITLTDGTRSWTEPCDYLACGYGLVPNVELAIHLGCELHAGLIRVNERQETSIPGIYAAGEVTGIGGIDKAEVEGRIAGIAAADRRDLNPQPHLRARAKAQRFADALAQAFELRQELKTLARPDTVICRCEDVLLSELEPYHSWRPAKLQTRLGMGPCQGRICGAALGFLRGWQTESVRPPVFPARVETLIEVQP